MISTRAALIIRLARQLSTSCRFCANHYDVLGITPKATQSEIKTAYYKLSKIHHPDKSKTEESANKFRSITEAYEVLGNVQLKKMYDKGLIVGKENKSRVEYRPEPEPTDPTLKFYKSRAKRQVAPTMDGKTPIYNFDDCLRAFKEIRRSRAHYGKLFEKSQYERNESQKIIKARKQRDETSQQEALLYFIVAIGGLFIFLVINGTADYDMDRTRYKKNNDEGREKD